MISIFNIKMKKHEKTIKEGSKPEKTRKGGSNLSKESAVKNNKKSRKNTNISNNKIRSRKRASDFKKIQNNIEQNENKISDEVSKENENLKRRTLFVGNVNVKTTRNKLKSFFEKFGTVETVRLRCIPVENINVSKKEAITTKKLHPKRKSMNAYVKFTSEESAQKGLVANGEILHDNHLIVNTSVKVKNNLNQKTSIFIGNLAFDVEEEDVWNFFEPCGEIASVRVVRSATVGSGKGFGFVTFKDKESLLKALYMNGKVLRERQIRVQRCAKKPKVMQNETENQKNSILKYDKPEELKKKIEERKPKKKKLSKPSYFGQESLTVKEKKLIKKRKWKPLSVKEKKEMFMAKALSRGAKD